MDRESVGSCLGVAAVAFALACSPPTIPRAERPDGGATTGGGTTNGGTTNGGTTNGGTTNGGTSGGSVGSGIDWATQASNSGLAIGMFVGPATTEPALTLAETRIGHHLDLLLVYHEIGNDPNSVGLPALLARLDKRRTTLCLALAPDKGATLDTIATGAADVALTKYADAIAKSNTVVWLRFAYDVNSDGAGALGFQIGADVSRNSPENFKKAWNHAHDLVAQRLTAVTGTKAQARWIFSVADHPVTSIAGRFSLSDFFPTAGVDAIALDGYNTTGTFRSFGGQTGISGSIFEDAYQTASALGSGSLPMMIGEFASARGDQFPSVGGDRPSWIGQAAGTLRSSYTRVNAITWFNANVGTHDYALTDDDGNYQPTGGGLTRVGSASSSYHAFCSGFGRNCPGNGTGTGTTTGTSTGTSTGTRTGTRTGTSTGTSTGTRTGTTTGTSTGTSAGTRTGTTTGTSTGTRTGTTTGTTTGTRTGTSTGTRTGISNLCNPPCRTGQQCIALVCVGGTSTGTSTGTRTGTATGTRTGTATGTRTGTATGTATGTVTGSNACSDTKPCADKTKICQKNQCVAASGITCSTSSDCHHVDGDGHVCGVCPKGQAECDAFVCTANGCYVDADCPGKKVGSCDFTGDAFDPNSAAGNCKSAEPTPTGPTCQTDADPTTCKAPTPVCCVKNPSDTSSTEGVCKASCQDKSSGGTIAAGKSCDPKNDQCDSTGGPNAPVDVTAEAGANYFCDPVSSTCKTPEQIAKTGSPCDPTAEGDAACNNARVHSGFHCSRTLKTCVLGCTINPEDPDNKDIDCPTGKVCTPSDADPTSGSCDFDGVDKSGVGGLNQPCKEGEATDAKLTADPLCDAKSDVQLWCSFELICRNVFSLGSLLQPCYNGNQCAPGLACIQSSTATDSTGAATGDDIFVCQDAAKVGVAGGQCNTSDLDNACKNGLLCEADSGACKSASAVGGKGQSCFIKGGTPTEPTLKCTQSDATKSDSCCDDSSCTDATILCCAGNHTCQLGTVLGTQNHQCTLDGSCNGGLTCVLAAPAKCVAAGGVNDGTDCYVCDLDSNGAGSADGASCRLEFPQCDPPLLCSDSDQKCHPSKSCKTGDDCDAGLTCAMVSGAVAGACAPVDEVGDDGLPCFHADNGVPPTNFCTGGPGGGLVCGADGMCSAGGGTPTGGGSGKMGDPCTGATQVADCASGQCDPILNTCLGSIGEDCSLIGSASCGSGFCDPVTNLCAPTPGNAGQPGGVCNADCSCQSGWICDDNSAACSGTCVCDLAAACVAAGCTPESGSCTVTDTKACTATCSQLTGCQNNNGGCVGEMGICEDGGGAFLTPVCKCDPVACFDTKHCNDDISACVEN